MIMKPRVIILSGDISSPYVECMYGRYNRGGDYVWAGRAKGSVELMGGASEGEC